MPTSELRMPLVHFAISVPGRPIAHVYVSDHDHKSGETVGDSEIVASDPQIVLDIKADGHLCSLFLAALSEPGLVSLFLRFMRKVWRKKRFLINLTLVEPPRPILDSRGGQMFERSAQERRELDCAMAFFSTLGGAFSALGDSQVDCAVIAGKISAQQFRLAMRLGDPFLQSRCRLYMALSLIQLKKFKLAKKIVINEYRFAKSNSIQDSRLVSMCLGIWAKLRYDLSRWKSSDVNSRSISL